MTDVVLEDLRLMGPSQADGILDPLVAARRRH